jgi:molybdopterin/thiamine biosynthesis adenylyltransferase
MIKSKKRIKIKIPIGIHRRVMEDLRRPHPFAHERVGFLFSKQVELEDCLIIFITEYHPVADKNYVRDSSVGAMINSTAIREAMQTVLDKSCGCFHVHLHAHTGVPSPSGVDRESLPNVVESFSNIDSSLAHGILILSRDSVYASIKTNRQKRFVNPELISIVGYPMNFVLGTSDKKKPDKIFDRQSFLGKKSQSIFANIKVGIVGYGGGGSHIGQQLAHLGVERITVFDEDKVEDTNLNRLIGAWYRDIKAATLKTKIAQRVIKKILPKAKLICVNKRWQNQAELLQECDIVFGCLDSYSERQQLEAECRRFLIPYIDIGMDVHKADSRPPYMSGQVILSLPGMPCMSCMGFLTDTKLAEEGAKYGAVGGRPQVVWANGMLASTAVGVFVDLVTGWTGQRDKIVYLSYDGNLGLVNNDIRGELVSAACEHYLVESSGAVKFTKL